MSDKFKLTPKEREELSFILQTFYVGKQDYDIAINAFEQLIQDRGNSIQEGENYLDVAYQDVMTEQDRQVKKMGSVES